MIHDRMPVIIAPEGYQRWLDPTTSVGPDFDLFVPVEDLTAHPVSTAVNSVRNNSPELVEPIPAEPAASGTRGERSTTWEIETPAGRRGRTCTPSRTVDPGPHWCSGMGSAAGLTPRTCVAITAALPEDGVEVVLVEQPWRVAGRRARGRPHPGSGVDRVPADVSSRGIGVPTTGRRWPQHGRAGGVPHRRRVRPGRRCCCSRSPCTRPGGRAWLGRRPAGCRSSWPQQRAVPTVRRAGHPRRHGSPEELAADLPQAAVSARVVPVSTPTTRSPSRPDRRVLGA